MTLLFILSSLIATILLAWFNSDFIVEYGKLFGMSKLLKLRDYRMKKLEHGGPTPTYPQFLRMTYDNFFVKLISCPICLSIWFSVALCLFYQLYGFIPVICIMSLMLYGICRKLLS